MSFATIYYIRLYVYIKQISNQLCSFFFFRFLRIFVSVFYSSFSNKSVKFLGLLIYRDTWFAVLVYLPKIPQLSRLPKNFC